MKEMVKTKKTTVKKLTKMLKKPTALSLDQQHPKAAASQSFQACNTSWTKRDSRESSLRKTSPVFKGFKRKWEKKRDYSKENEIYQLREKKTELKQKSAVTERTND